MYVGGRGFFTQILGLQGHAVGVDKEIVMQSLYKINMLSFYYTCGFLQPHRRFDPSFAGPSS